MSKKKEKNASLPPTTISEMIEYMLRLERDVLYSGTESSYTTQHVAWCRGQATGIARVRAQLEKLRELEYELVP